MKRFVLLTMMLFAFGIVSKTQTSITLTISKEIKNNETYLKVSLNNNNASEIIVFNGAQWPGNMGEYLKSPLSYYTFIGNPKESTQKESRIIVITKETDPKDIEKGMMYVPIPAKSSKIESYQLFGVDYGPTRAFSVSVKDKAIIKKVQVKANINYFDMQTQKKYSLELTSNIITL